MIRNNRQRPVPAAAVPSSGSAARVWMALVLSFVHVSLGQRAFASQDFAATNESSQGAELEAIVVTATKREENIQNVPVSIYAMSQNDLVLAGAKNMDDIAALSPGIQFDNQSGYGTGTLTFISIRGVNSGIGASTTGVYIDDTAVQGRLNQFTNFGNSYPVTFDLNRVEVARGPQGTLFGAGAEGGTVRFIFNQPNLQSFSGQGDHGG
jgi:iron complex outermembrane recepter protein